MTLVPIRAARRKRFDRDAGDRWTTVSRVSRALTAKSAAAGRA